MQLLESGRQHSLTRKLGLDMLRQLSLHHDYALLLVQDGYYLEALRYAWKYKVIPTLESEERKDFMHIFTIIAVHFLLVLHSTLFLLAVAVFSVHSLSQPTS